MFGFEVENEPVSKKLLRFHFGSASFRAQRRLLRTCVLIFVFYKLCRYSQFIVSRFGNQCAV
jgi:hypothetical protein